LNIIRSLNTKWKLIQKERNININVNVPSTVFESLIENDVIENPFYGINEKKMKWVYSSSWEYRKIFSLTAEDLEAHELILRFNGLDTIGKILLNDIEIGKVDNMHLAWEYPLISEFRELLKDGENTVSILFESPVLTAAMLIKKYRRNLTDMPFFMKRASLDGSSYLRKALYSFGWDWGPQLPDTGIWRDVELEIIHFGKIDNLLVSQKHTAGQCEVTANISMKEYIQSDLVTGNYSYRVCLKGPGFSEEKTADISDDSISFLIIDPHLWWTYDLGNPELYSLNVQLLCNLSIVDEKILTIGLRDLQLIRDRDKWGETFYFKLNGVPVFARGANWIPVDSFIARGRKLGLYEKRIDDVLSANMNMIRVWGGGIYEDDHFYDLCDQNGILVWQDFMFACLTIPRHKSFFESVKREAVYNLKRLRHHASIALWVGNNEIETAWVNWGYSFRFPFHRKSYLKMFEAVLPDLVKKYDPERDYRPSSPSSTGGFKDPESPDSGDSHFWQVWHGGEPFSSFRTHYSRFMSEFGFESFPHMKSIKSFSEKDDYSFHSKVMENHQKNGAGNKKILSYMNKRFKEVNRFEHQVILSQLTQAEAMEYGVDHWRRNRNNYRCMGALYWQLNDCWPVASWSSVDYFGRWKALHYFARRFFSPFYCNVAEFKDYFEIWGVNDLNASRTALLKWSYVKESGEIIDAGELNIHINAVSSQLLHRKEISEIQSLKGILFYSFVHDGKTTFNGMKLLKAPRDYQLENPLLSVKCDSAEGHNLVISVLASKPAVYIQIDSKYDFKISDNFFSLNSGESRTLKIDLTEDISDNEFFQSLKLFSLYDFCC